MSRQQEVVLAWHEASRKRRRSSNRSDLLSLCYDSSGHQKTTMSPPINYRFDIEQGSDEWHAARRGLITASTIGKLITATGKPASNDTSRAQLLQLLAERITGESDPSFYNDDMARGHLLEPFARDLYSQLYSPVQECGFITATFDDTTIGYSPDGLVGDYGLIEIKSPRKKKHLESLLNDEIPVEYMAQIQTGLAVSGRLWCAFISYAPGLPLYVKQIGRDEIYIDKLITAAQSAEKQLCMWQMIYDERAIAYPATESIQPEQEIII